MHAPLLKSRTFTGRSYTSAQWSAASRSGLSTCCCVAQQSHRLEKQSLGMAGSSPATTSSSNRSNITPFETFQKGVALSVWQNSSDQHSNWTAFTQKKKFFGQSEFEYAFNKSNDFWNRYDEDIQLVKAVGANSFRFSFEWARIEPQPGAIDRSAIAKYHEILDSLERHGLMANATLHHFTHPQWFEARGGFANAANTAAFVRYCRLIFEEFGGRIPFWATFNEASCFSFCGYIMGIWAPGQKFRFIKAGKVLGNMLRAHVEVYRTLKSMKHGQQAQIGFVHQHIRFQPKCNWLAGLIVKPVCRWMTTWFAADTVLSFFTTGKFTWRAPLLGTVIKFDVPEAVGAFDWWGINYYSRPCINSKFQLVGLDPVAEPLTGMGMPLVSSDMYHHIMRVSNTLRCLIIISETGVSDLHHTLRSKCITSYYDEVLKAIAAGADVRGIFYWTLMDNIEWHHGFNQHFGLYDWRPNGQGETVRLDTALSLRPGSEVLVDVHTSWPDRISDMAVYASNKQQVLQDFTSSHSDSSHVCMLLQEQGHQSSSHY